MSITYLLTYLLVSWHFARYLCCSLSLSVAMLLSCILSCIRRSSFPERTRRHSTCATSAVAGTDADGSDVQRCRRRRQRKVADGRAGFSRRVGGLWLSSQQCNADEEIIWLPVFPQWRWTAGKQQQLLVTVTPCASANFGRSGIVTAGPRTHSGSSDGDDISDDVKLPSLTPWQAETTNFHSIPIVPLVLRLAIRMDSHTYFCWRLLAS